MLKHSANSTKSMIVTALIGLAAFTGACGRGDSIPPNANLNSNSLRCLPGQPYTSSGAPCVTASSIEQLCSVWQGQIIDTMNGRLCRATFKGSYTYSFNDFSRLTPAMTTPTGTVVSVPVATFPSDRISITASAKYGSDKDNGGFLACRSDGDYDVDQDGVSLSTNLLVNNTENGLPAGLVMSNGKQALPLFQGGPTYSFAAAGDRLYFGFNAVKPSKPCTKMSLSVSIERCFNLSGQSFACQ